jgi:hypothetical protein
MIKKLLFSMVALLAMTNLMQAQTCTPIQNFPDSAIAIPPSWSALRLSGGIQDTACIGSYFEFTLSIKTPGAIPGLPGFAISSITMPVTNGVANLPAGMSYVCNPPNCAFPRDSVSCIKLFGTPTNPADVGQKDLTLSLTLNLFPAGQLPNIPYPNQTLDPGGHYYLFVKPQGSSGCFVSSTDERQALAGSIRSFPNPSSGFTQIVFDTPEAGQYEFIVTDLAGKAVHRERLQIFSGENTIPFDGSSLANGMYLYSLSNGLQSLTEKLVISKL